jgi:hypothetical protein
MRVCSRFELGFDGGRQGESFGASRFACEGLGVLVAAVAMQLVSESSSESHYARERVRVGKSQSCTASSLSHSSSALVFDPQEQMSSVDADDPWAPAPVAQPPQPDTDAEDSISPADIQAKEQLVKYAHPRPAGWVSDSRPHTYPPQEHHKQAGRTPR